MTLTDEKRPSDFNIDDVSFRAELALSTNPKYNENSSKDKVNVQKLFRQ